MSTTRPAPLDHPTHPGIQHYLDQRAADAQARVADAITAFAGSMKFVYLHAVVFALWMLFGRGATRGRR